MKRAAKTNLLGSAAMLSAWQCMACVVECGEILSGDCESALSAMIVCFAGSFIYCGIWRLAFVILWHFVRFAGEFLQYGRQGKPEDRGYL